MRKLLLSLILLFLVAAPAFATTTNTFKVGNTGGAGCDGACDYSSLAGWEAARENDLVASDFIEIANCYIFTDTSTVLIDGWLTTDTNYIEISTVSSTRHSGIYTTSAYRLEANSVSRVFDINEQYVRVFGLQFHNINASGRGVRYQTTATVGEFQFANNVFKGSVFADNANSINLEPEAGSTIKIWNNIVYDAHKGITFSFGDIGCVFAIYNNTIVSATLDGIEITDAVDHADLYLKNNLVQDSGGSDFDVATFTTRNYLTNLSSDATSPTLSLSNLSVTFANEGADDFHLQSWEPSANLGVDLTPDEDGFIEYSFDIGGDRMGWRWPLGADEVPGEVNVIPLSKPPAGTKIKFGHPASEDLVLALYLNENTGSPWDASENGNTSIISGASWAPGGLGFDGSAHVVIDDVLDNLVSATTGTLVLRFTPTVVTDVNVYMICFGDTDNNEFIALRHGVPDAGHVGMVARKAGVNQWRFRADDVVLSVGVEIEVAVVQNGVEPKMYIDGVAVPQSFDATFDKTVWFNDLTGLDNGRMGIGNFNGFGDVFGPFDGVIHNVKLYNRAMTDDEIRDNYLDPYILLRRPPQPPFFAPPPPPESSGGLIFESPTFGRMFR